jgi:O-antigen/teichoic acid export membrane protein
VTVRVDESDRLRAGGTAQAATTRHIRGSTVLFGGRMLSLGLNLLAQVLIVRALSKADYGAFAYALALVASGRTLVSLGLHQSLTRFLALYEEQRAYDKLFGTIVMEIGTIVSAGLFLFALVLGLQNVLVGTLVDDPQAIAILAILVLLAPLEALDRMFEGAFAVFAKPRAIFVRKYLFTPGLRLVVVALLLASHSSVTFLAVGYVITGVLGVAVYTWLLVGVLRRRQLLSQFQPRTIQMPFREVFSFTAPLLSRELVTVSIVTVSVALLGYFTNTEAVAEYRAIYPAAHLNQLVLFTFELLFVPLATRMFARGDAAGMRTAYWQTAAWVAVLTFPVFALTVPLAEPTTIALFGERYRDSAPLLAILAFGYYFNAALGFNAVTLAVCGRLRYVLHVNLACALLNVVLSLLLIPPLEAVGVAIANGATLVIMNVLNQAGLGRGIGVPLFEWRYARLYGLILICAALLAAVQTVVEPPFAVAVALAAVASLVVLRFNRGVLELAGTFPELRRIPFLSRLMGDTGSADR